MEENLIGSLKLARKSLDELQDTNKVIESPNSSLLRLSSALKNIDKEVNKLRNIMNVTMKNSH
jgi:hypothetical protein